MKLEQQVTSLELSKKLKELGVKQESLFLWGERFVTPFNAKKALQDNKLEWRLYFVSINKPILGGDIPAYTVAELGEILPWKLEMTGLEWRELEMNPCNKKLRKFDSDDEDLYFHLITDKNTYKSGIEYNAYYMEEYTHGACINNKTGNGAKTEANARAKMLIYLLENNLMKT